MTLLIANKLQWSLFTKRVKYRSIYFKVVQKRPLVGMQETASKNYFYAVAYFAVGLISSTWTNVKYDIPQWICSDVFLFHQMYSVPNSEEILRNNSFSPFTKIIVRWMLILEWFWWTQGSGISLLQFEPLSPRQLCRRGCRSLIFDWVSSSSFFHLHLNMPKCQMSERILLIVVDNWFLFAGCCCILSSFTLRIRIFRVLSFGQFFLAI